MQFGSSPKVFKLEYALLFFLLGTGLSPAQIPQFGQALGNTAGQQSCDPSDPTCQGSLDQGNYQNNSLYNQQQQSPTRSNGIELPGQQLGNQNNSLNPQASQAQQQLNALQNLPLDSPSAFQLAVANSTGKMLPIYGVNLFRRPPSTFAPLNMVPVTPDYVIGPGDELLIQAWGQVTLNSRYTVDRSGNIYIPQVGSLHVAGLSFAQIQGYLKAQMGRVFRNFDLNVNMGSLRSIQIFIVGQARRPGSYVISSLSTLTNALFATGGPTPQGSMRHIQLKRSGKVVVDFDLYDLLQHGDKSNDVQLLPGDVIYIPPVGPQVAVAGSVNVPAIYELKSADTSTVGDVLGLAAGLTSVASDEKVRIERVDDHRMRSISEVTLDTQGRATVLRDGDLLEVEAIVNQYKNAVTLRGNVANPGRYVWKPGMRVRDLLPNKDALITRDYWLKRSQLGQPGLTYIPTCPPMTTYGIPSLRYGIPVGEEGDNPNWRYSSTRNPNLIGLAFGNDDQRSPNNPYNNSDSNSNSYDTSGEPQLPPSTDGGLNCIRVPEYTPGVRELSNNRNPSSRDTTGSTGSTTASSNGLRNGTDANDQESAASASVGLTSRNSSAGQFRPRNNVKLSEPDIDWSYAVIERQSKENLTTSLLPFNLGKAVLEGDTSQNLELMPGDVVTIFSKADIRVPQAQQTRFVRLEGEFGSSGIYSVRPGETLRELVKRAGGLTSEAYLYGSEFTRESTRRVQQQHLNAYVDQIALQASPNATSNFGSAVSAQDTAALAAAQQQNQNIVNSLRRARATGRIVLNLQPDSHDVADLPDLPLEDGDQFIVPRIPSTVSVDGAVYNQNSFVYDPHKRLGDYIRQAGGANRDADKGRGYVIRASGAVISKQYSSALRGHSFDSIRLYPGDTVVIPLNLDKGKKLRLVVDIAQIVGQFGIAIAAANVIF